VKDGDVVIVGAGLAGLTAALISAQHGLRTIVVDQAGSAGQVLNVQKIMNLPGFPEGIAGYDLGPIVQEQAEAAGAEFAFDVATGLGVEAEARILHCDEEDIRARAVIIAAGSSLLKLGIPGEETLFGRGVSNCASCDGPFFAGGTVAVVGGGDSAVEEAVVLTEYAQKVLLFERGEALTAQHSLLDALKTRSGVDVITNASVEAVLGEDAVTGVKVRDTRSGEMREEAVAGVFVYAGLQPNTAFLQGVVDLDPAGHIVTDIDMRSSVPGVFAAGDVRQRSVSLLISAMGDGATAAVSAYRYVRGIAR
jgi:thioredoxin reductase (NADPH)